jgi:RNA polymerase sigma-70 factor (ECF subfamily)
MFDMVPLIRSASLIRIVEVQRLDHRVGRGADPSDSWDWDEVRTEAEDIAQDSMVRAWRKRTTLRNSEARRAWLATIVRNEALREFARKRPSPTDTLETWQGSDDERVLATVERADLHAALERLNKRDRQLVRLRYDEDMTQEAIAHRLGIPLGTVKVRLHRVRAKLRREIGAV